MQYSEDDARNFTRYDTADIHAIFAYINTMYNQFGLPTRPVEGVPFFNKSNIYFKIQGIYFHVDSLGWKIDYLEPRGLEKILKYDANTNFLTIRGNSYKVYDKKEGLQLRYKNHKTKRVMVDSAYSARGFIHLRPK